MDRSEAAAEYRARVSRAFKRYKAGLQAAWDDCGQSLTSETCRRMMALRWDILVLDLQAAGRWLDHHPVRLP